MKKKPPNNKKQKKQPQNHTRLKIPLEQAEDILARIVGRDLPPSNPTKKTPPKDYPDEADGGIGQAAKSNS